MILLTIGVLLGRPDWGLYWVVCWTLLSTALMALRLGYAAIVRAASGPLHSWLEDAEVAQGAVDVLEGTLPAFEQRRGRYVFCGTAKR